MERLFAFCCPDFGCDRRAHSTVRGHHNQPRPPSPRDMQYLGQRPHRSLHPQRCGAHLRATPRSTPIEQHVLAAAMEQPRSSDQRRLQDELRRGI
jgi:hypothetical protein